MERAFRQPQIAAFRLARHHLLEHRGSGKVSRPDLAALCREVCGV